MEPIRFDHIAKLFAGRGLSRRQALAQGGAGLAAATLVAAGIGSGSAQEATPAATDEEPNADNGPTMLFLQTYQSGSITPVDGVDGRYTLSLEAGHGQTIYFSDRPDRIVGSSPTPQFLEGLGFLDDNPPNAALVVETAPGETDVAVVELFNPVYDPISQGVTYEIEVLGNWQAELEMEFHEAPTDLATLAPAFGSAQLFIDDCPDGNIVCWRDETNVGYITNEEHNGYCYSPGAWGCLPCTPWFTEYNPLVSYWARRCNQKFSNCAGECTPRQLCTAGWNCEV